MNHEKICGNCKHFKLHYVKYPNGEYVPLYYGHCVHPRLRKRESEKEACPHWGQGNLQAMLFCRAVALLPPIDAAAVAFGVCGRSRAPALQPENLVKSTGRHKVCPYIPCNNATSHYINTAKLTAFVILIKTPEEAPNASPGECRFLIE